MANKELFEALSNDDAERERVRSIFAIAAIALLYYLRQMNGNNPVTLIPAIPPYFPTPFTGDEVMTFWGLYVLAVTVSLAVSKQTTDSVWNRTVRRSLRGIYFFANLCYLFSVLMLLTVLTVYAVLILAGFPIIGFLIWIGVAQVAVHILFERYRARHNVKRNL